MRNVVRINFQDFVFVGFVYQAYVLFRKMVKIIQKTVIETILD